MPSLVHQAIAITALISALGNTVHAQANEQPRGSPEVRRLVIRGVKQVDKQDLEKSIATQASTCRSIVLEPFCIFSKSPTFEEKHYLDEAELRRDVVRIRLYYWLRGYRETKVDTAITPSGANKVHITFTVTEGPPTRIERLTLSYDTSLISPKVRDRLTLLHVNDPLDLIRLDSMTVMFRDELWNKGYGDAVADTIISVNARARLADVVLRVTANHLTTVGSITITGNKKVPDRTIRNSITFGPGDLFRLSDVLQSQRNLYESNLFRLAKITIPPQRDSVKNVDIQVTESPLHEARVGPGFNNVDFLQFQGHYTDYNFLGGARRLDIDATVGNLFARGLSGHGPFRNVAADVPDTNVSAFLKPTYTASVDLKKPSFLRPGDAVAIGGFSHRTLNPGVFVDYGYGGQLTYTHEVAIRAPISVSYRYELNRVIASDTYFCVNYGVCDTLTIGSLRTHQSLSPLTLTGFVDRSDKPFSPTKGYIARVDYEYASQFTQSDFHYQRLFFDGAVYDHKSGSRMVYGFHLRFGKVGALHGGPDGDVLHPRKRFYAGGANSVRGFTENQLGPRILTINDSTLLAAAASSSGGICALTLENIKFCDPNAPKLKNSDFLSQPLGGTSLLEGSVEYRFPIGSGYVMRKFLLATFVDAGFVGAGDFEGLQSVSQFIHSQGAITPGIGLRYLSGIGPIRLDVGFNPSRRETLGVVTTVRDANGALVIAPLAIPRRSFAGRNWFDRLALHFSIGEAF